MPWDRSERPSGCRVRRPTPPPQGAWSPAVCWTVCLWHSRERKRATRRLRTTGWGVIGLPHRTHQLHEDRASPPILENGYGTRHTSNVFESEVGRRSVRLQAVHDQEPDYWTIGLESVLNDRTCRWSANVQQHRVDGNEIFSIPIRISSTSDVKDEILQRISEIRMQTLNPKPANHPERWRMARHPPGRCPWIGPS